MNAGKQSQPGSTGGRRPGDGNPATASVVHMGHSTADMLHRTSKPGAVPSDSRPWHERAERLDYLAVERIAREMRSDYVATLLSRWAHALRALIAGRSRDESGKAALAP